MLKNKKVLAYVVGAVLLTIIVLQNRQDDSTRVLDSAETLPRAQQHYLMLGIGFVAGLFARGRLGGASRPKKG